jgi:hypothetical protein
VGDDKAPERWLGVTESLWRQLRREVAVFRAHIVPTLTIAGPPDLAKKLFDLPEGTRVHVEGAIERRSHTFLLGVVNPVHAAPTQQ